MLCIYMQNRPFRQTGSKRHINLPFSYWLNAGADLTEGGGGLIGWLGTPLLQFVNTKKVVNTLAKIKVKVLDSYLIVNSVCSLWHF